MFLFFRIQAGHVARVGEVRGVYRVWGYNWGNRKLGRHRRRWEDNNKMYLK